MNKLLSRSIALVLAVSGTAYASTSANSVPSCYEANKMSVAPPATKKELFVLVDQTTPLDAKLQALVRENVGRLVQPGNAFTIAKFSSFGQGQYLEVLSSGTLEEGLSEDDRNSTGAKVLRNFDKCLKSQLDYGRRIAGAALNEALSGSSTDFAKSDVMGSVKEMSARVRESQANEKVLFLVSDMLENSGVSSFYASKNVKTLDVNAELKKAEAAKMFGDHGGARVYVLGAGLVQATTKDGAKDSGVYRLPAAMARLQEFWQQYFEQSNAKLEHFGAPALLVPVK